MLLLDVVHLGSPDVDPTCCCDGGVREHHSEGGATRYVVVRVSSCVRLSCSFGARCDFSWFSAPGLVTIERHTTLTRQSSAAAYKLFISQFINTGIVVLIVSGRLPNDVEFPVHGIGILEVCEAPHACDTLWVFTENGGPTMAVLLWRYREPMTISLWSGSPLLALHFS